ncbi:isoprenoid synthase domain-containing protein [Microdochium trichocladiopsis]|uniref:Isoprenoid synthase domain-containing protein n=1 Tax=Microdochium trichocladiopsis TaxID=1682393 RepID=A0A9P8YJG4_9PEZI|nr:isoprenoid synthase domain-containing protein [Microdochium trichocladiopsis]KAH7041405.1 isoprenoid synthase domain-containing protein [Microdochium trichocladiopsis]
MSSSHLPPDALSVVIDASEYDTQGFGAGWETRRHRHESVANRASFEARADWLRLVGPTDEFGSCNPPNGNWTALTMPFCRPERMWIAAYIVEFAFIHDTVIERQLPDVQSENHQITDGGDVASPPAIVDPQLGKKKLRARMTRDLLAIDPVRGRECLAEWQNMIDLTHREKTTSFASVEEYVEFRLVDCGAPWMASLMLYGMGITLPASEREELKHVTRPFCAAAGLQNDYFSFVREYADQRSDAAASTPIMINLVALLTQWRGVDIATAKQLTREVTIGYEREYDLRCAEYRARKHALGQEVAEEVALYLRGVRCLLAGNIVWSSNCPRYHAKMRYDPNAGLEDALTLEKRGVDISVI